MDEAPDEELVRESIEQLYIWILQKIVMKRYETLNPFGSGDEKLVRVSVTTAENQGWNYTDWENYGNFDWDIISVTDFFEIQIDYGKI